MNHHRFIAFLLSVISVLFMFALSAPASAEIKRHCKMSYKVVLSQGIKTDGRPFFLIAPLQDAQLPLKFVNPDGPTNPSDFMQASGQCGNAVPNRCRRRASAKLQKCAQQQFSNLNNRPASCGVVKNYLQGARMSDFIKEKACSRLTKTYYRYTYTQTPQSYSVTATPNINIFGDKGCDKRLSFEKMTIQCGQ